MTEPDYAADEPTPDELNELAALDAERPPTEIWSGVKRKRGARIISIHGGPPPMSPDTREAIDAGDELHRQCNAALRALAADRGVYHRDSKLVHVVRLAVRHEGPLDRPAGTPELRELSSSALAARLSALVRWYRKRKGEEVPCFPPSAVCRAICDFGQWAGLRRLEGIIETPAFRPDGSLIIVPGWDPATGLLYAPSEHYGDVLVAPTQEQARAALIELLEPFADFPYARPEQIAVPVAAILTLLCRPAIRGAVPAFLFDASDRGAGKSLQVQIVARIASGRWSRPRVFPATQGRVNEEELAKVLGALALSGRSMVDFDNVRCPIDGAPLLAALTTIEEQEFRVLGESRDALMSWIAVVCMGGNNLAIGDEMSRRCLVARAEPPDERHELRADLTREQGGYMHPRLRAWVAEHRARLVVAALTVLAGWFAAGRPKQAIGTKASFEEWSDIVPHAIIWAGGPDVTLCVSSVEEADEDPYKGALRSLLAIWGRLEGPDGMTARWLIELLYPSGKRPLPGDGPPDEACDAARDAIEFLVKHRSGDRNAPSADSFGRRLSRFKGTKLNGKCLKSTGKTHGVIRWKLTP